MNITAFDLASRYIGVEEVPGSKHNPAIMAMLKLDANWPASDEVPWCSGFVNWIAWHLNLPRSKSLMARSWLRIGKSVDPKDAKVGWDVVVLWRGSPTASTGHVGFYAGQSKDTIKILGGNQGDTVSVRDYSKSKLLDIRRLWG